MRSFNLGSPLGFPLKVNLSFLILLAGVWLWAGGVPGVAMMVLAFAGVVVHELGHAVVARRLGVRIKEIELGFFGGAAKMLDAPRGPRDEIAIAAAGPAVSFAIAAVSHFSASSTTGALSSLLTWVATVNFGVGLFNMVPALPMDGGRILRALLSFRFGHLRATEVAVKVARVFALGLGLVGLFGLHFQLVALAFVVWSMGTAELFSARQQYAYGEMGSYAGPAEVEYIPPGGSRQSQVPQQPPGAPKVFVFRL
jgi:Zn-dependent protease